MSLNEEKAYEDQDTWKEIIDIARERHADGESFKLIAADLVHDYEKWLDKWYPGNEFDLRQELEDIVTSDEDDADEAPAESKKQIIHRLLRRTMR